MRLACCQFDVQFREPERNAARAVESLGELSAQGVDIVVFPEAFLTGYCVSTPEDARKLAIPDDHLAVVSVLQAARDMGMHVAFGYAANRNNILYNSAVLACPDGTVHRYDKAHLPILGYDRFVEPGRELPVFETALGRIGLLICFDLRPPEAARTLALRGADLILLPTNWPNGAQISAEHFTLVRAAESRVFLAACNRVGTENGFTFIGKSTIVSPAGVARAIAGEGEEILIADLDLAEARNKMITVVPNEYEMAVFGCRQPDIYETA